MGRLQQRRRQRWLSGDGGSGDGSGGSRCGSSTCGDSVASEAPLCPPPFPVPLLPAPLPTLLPRSAPRSANPLSAPLSALAPRPRFERRARRMFREASQRPGTGPPRASRPWVCPRPAEGHYPSFPSFELACRPPLSTRAPLPSSPLPFAVPPLSPCLCRRPRRLHIWSSALSPPPPPRRAPPPLLQTPPPSPPPLAASALVAYTASHSLRFRLRSNSHLVECRLSVHDE